MAFMAFRDAWILLKERPQPRYLREIRRMRYDQFRTSVMAGNREFVERMTNSLYAGDTWILEQAF